MRTSISIRGKNTAHITRWGDGIAYYFKTISLVTFGALSLACSTPYQPMGFKGGYEEVEIEKDTFQLEFRGNANTSLTRISGYWHQRAKEICNVRGKVPQVLDVKSESKLASFQGGNLQYKPMQIGHIRCVSTTANQGSNGSWDMKANTEVFPVLMPPTVKQVSRIAVLPLSENFGTDVPAQLDYAVGFIRALRPEIIFVERESLDKIADELHLQYSGRIDDDSTKRVGKMVGADTLLLYKIIPVDKTRTNLVQSSGGTVSGGVEVHLIQVEMGTSLFRQTVTAKTFFPPPSKGGSWTEEGVIRAHGIAATEAAAYAFSALVASLGANPLGLVPAVDVVGFVVGVLSASPAEAAGLMAGDKIVSVNGRAYRSWTDRIDLPATMTVLREGKELQLYASSR